MSQDFRPFFCFKDSAWVPIAPYKQAKTVSRTFFVFAKIFDRKVRISRVHVLSLAGTSRTSKFFFRYGRFHIFKLLLLIFFDSPPRPGFYYIIYTVLQCDLPPLRPHSGEVTDRVSNTGRAI